MGRASINGFLSCRSNSSDDQLTCCLWQNYSSLSDALFSACSAVVEAKEAIPVL